MAKATVTHVPTLEEILEARGVGLDRAKKAVSELAARFPDGLIPDQAIEAWLNEHFSVSVVRAALGDAGRAWAKLASTGKGPVGHSAGECA
jgi:hypothetical protein